MTVRETKSFGDPKDADRQKRSELLRAVLEPPHLKDSADDSVLVSVIVLNFNGERVLARCVESIFTQRHPKWELIILDNGSSDGSAEIIARYQSESLKRFGEQRLRSITQRKNLGVAGGRNRAMEEVRGEVVAFIDNDGAADANWLSNAVRLLSGDVTIGALAPLVCFSAEPLQINGAGGAISRNGHGWDIGFGTSLQSAPRSADVAFAMGCGMVLRRTAADKIFPLDDVLRKWFDDTEIGIRCWALGLRVVFDPGLLIDHDYHGSHPFVMRRRWQQAFTYEAARIRMTIKYFPVGTVIRSLTGEPNELFREPTVLGWKRYVMRCFAACWNVLHLFGALAIRRRYPSAWCNIEKFTVQNELVRER